ncbi:NHL repeat-containing protein [Halapricum salinum]|uniref:DUF4394 domain-containing protein n=1 Tax=Halapricum salinum TaxID=1457250 RepID=A0A4D6H8N1_9EURY|nr:DUF4394 domain-containing protein [Halapricum salinum]QCC50120.1 DUF4394 domain-containing protein [Halapricum salinum]
MATLDGLFTIQTSAGHERILKLSPETAEVTPVVDLDAPSRFGPNALAFGPGGRILGNSGSGNYIFEIDPETGAVERLRSIGPSLPGMAFVDSDTVYGLDNDNDRLVRVDPESGALTTVGGFGRDLDHVGLGVDFETKELYAVGGRGDGDPDRLYHVDKTDGSVTPVGTTGVDLDSVGVEFVPGNGNLYALRGDEPETTTLRKLDLETGVGVEIGPVPVGGLANLGAPWPQTTVEPPTPPETATPVGGGGSTPPSTQTPVDPDDLDFRAGSTVEVDVGYGNYYVVTDIPDANGRPAVTTTDFSLVAPEVAHDAFITESWKSFGPSLIDWQKQLAATRRRAGEFRALELLSKAVDLGVESLETYALAQVNPSLALGSAVDLYFESINWVNTEVNDPYEEGFGKMTRTLAECRNIDALAEDVTSWSEFNEGLNATAEFAVALDDIASNADNIAAAWSQATSNTGKVTASLTSYGLQQAAASIFVGVAVDTTVTQLIEGALDANAKITAAAHAHEVAQMTLIERIIGLELKREDAAITPAEAVTLTRLKAARYQMTALLGEIVAKHYDAMSDLWSGVIWNAVANAETNARQAREMADSSRQTTYWTWRMMGYGLNRAENRLENSLNTGRETA